MIGFQQITSLLGSRMFCMLSNRQPRKSKASRLPFKSNLKPIISNVLFDDDFTETITALSNVDIFWLTDTKRNYTERDIRTSRNNVAITFNFHLRFPLVKSRTVQNLLTLMEYCYPLQLHHRPRDMYLKFDSCLPYYHHPTFPL